MQLPRFLAFDVPALIRQELSRLTSTKMGTLALIALMCVPLLYGGLYLWANKDPQGSFDHLAVAVVNDDAGAPQSDGTTANHGAQVARTLVDGGAFDWDEVDDEAARRGVDNGAYAFAVVFPGEFSADLESITGDRPRQARIELRTNDANNTIATQAGQRAVEAVRDAIARETGDTASLRMLDGLATVRAGFDAASSGAGQLADGEGQAISGADQLAEGSGRLSEGAAQLATGASRLAEGAGSLAEGARQASSGASQLSSGLGELDARMASFPEQASQLAEGARQVAQGDAQIAEAADRIGGASQELADALPTARDDIASRLRERGLDEATVQAALSALDPLRERIETTNATVQGRVSDLDRLSAGSQQVAAGAQALSEAAPELQDGIHRAAEGAGALESGASQLAEGADALGTGATQLSSGAAQLGDGADQLGTGLSGLRSGLVTLQVGAGTLRDELASGRDTIPVTTQAVRDAQANTIADPVHIDEVSSAKAETYGAGLAPFFVTLAAWIGIYSLFLLVKPFSRRAATAMWTPVRVTLAGWATPALLGALQMVLVFGIVTGLLGFHMIHAGATLGIMLLASATFAAIIMALNIWLGSVGQFVGLLLMILQLVTAGGTFPWQTLPAPLAALHRLLPMSWSVEALRQAMLGGNMALAAGDAALLAMVLAGSLAVAALGITRVTSTRIMRDIQPSLLG